MEWIRGDYGIADATAEPLLRTACRGGAAWCCCCWSRCTWWRCARNGSNNPDGIEIKEKKGADGKPLDGIPFHPYYTLKDLVGVGVFLIGFAVVVFFVPTFGGLFLEGPNFEPANPLSTPEHIAPHVVLHALLRDPARRAGPADGCAADGAVHHLPHRAAVARPFAGQVHATRYRPLTWKLALTVFAVSFIALGYLGLKPAEGTYVFLARLFHGAVFRVLRADAVLHAW